MNNTILKNPTFNLFSVFCSICMLLLIVSFAEQKMPSKEMKSSVLAAGECPGIYMYVAAGDFCIEKDLHDAGSPLFWEDAVVACAADDGAHLCKASEWAQACNMNAGGIIALNNMGSQYEWVDDFSKKNEAFMVGETSCEDYEIANPFNSGGHIEEYRCCKNIVK